MFVRLCHLVKFRFKVWSRAHKYSVPSLNFEVQSWPSLPLTFTLKRRRAADKLWAHLAIFNLKSPQIMKLWKNSAMNLPFLTGLDSRSSYFCPFTPTSTLLSTNPSTRLSSFNEIPLTIANWHEKISLPQRPLSSFYEFSRIDLMWIWGLPRALYDKNIWGILVKLVIWVIPGHPNSKIANLMKLVNFAFFSSQYHVFELKNIRGNLIAPNSNRWSLSNKIAMSQEDNRRIISLFGQEKSIFLHPSMLKGLM